MKQKILFLLFSLFTLTIPIHPQWTPVRGGDAPSVYSMVIMDSVLIAGTKKGTEFSADGGKSWKKQLNSLQKLPIYSLCLSGGALYIGTPIGAFVSKDSGNTVNQYHFRPDGVKEDTVEVYDFHVKGNEIVCATNIGVYFSRDTGSTWRKSGSEFDNNSVLEFTYMNKTLYAAVFGEGIFKSTNSGTTWVHTSLTKEHVAHLTNDGKNIYAGAAGEGLLVSRDEGKTWYRVNDYLKKQSIYSLLAADGYVYAGAENGVSISGNEGVDWTDEKVGKTGIYSLVGNGRVIIAGTRGEGLWLRNALKKKNAASKKHK
jgi:photosystem II stability/assembly factor-like uncharacterized protein